MEESIFDSFDINLKCWKIFGVWAGKFPSPCYKYYSFLCLFPFLIVYDVLLTVNLFYTPPEVNLIIEELMFYFNGVAIMTKVVTIIFWRKEILETFDVLDCDYFKGSDKDGREIVKQSVNTYTFCWKLHALFCHICFFFGSVFSVLLYFLSIDSEIKLPVSKYHFLTAETKNRYFGFLYAYQFIGIYIQMMYNVTVDSFFAGLLFYAITQVRILKHELRCLQWKKQNVEDIQEIARFHKLNYCLRHYETLLKYCASVQDLFSVLLFIQMGISSVLICSVLCALVLPDIKVIFMLTFLSEMILQIFLPSWLGTQLTSESEQLVLAAYESDWLKRCRPYSTSLKLFIERANTPLVITGANLFALNLETFVKIMKTAYSFMALVRTLQERN